MGLELDYQRGLRQAGNVSPERMAVPDATGLAKNMARATAGQYLSDANTGLAIRGMEAENRFARQDMSMARKDSGLALSVMAANTGLTMAANRERTKAQQEAEQRDQEQLLYFRALGEIMERHGEEMIKRLYVEPSATGGA